jgi:cellulose synthase/poly-beta-1,6-N-acetylglucosamine synthase-like glycosyltransferase
MKLPWYLLGGSAALAGYAYLGYPVLVKALSTLRPSPRPSPPPAEWPRISITVPVYNEEAQIRELLESLLALDYPADRRQILIVSDASSDRTDEIVREYADRDVELLRLPARGGKTAAENAALPHLRGEIVVNTDASIRIHPQALRPLIAAFSDPEVGVASGRDLSVTSHEEDPNAGESGYVGYEMWVRACETRLGGIVGASGCFYAIRTELHRRLLPGALARDFAAPLIAREQGYRAVSVDQALCFVPRTPSLRREYRRKVRTMAGGMETLLYFDHLLNPFRYGAFSWMLFSHKVARWLVPAALAASAAGIGLQSVTDRQARWGIAAMAAGGALAGLGLAWPEGRKVPRPLAIAAYGAAGNVAVLHAWARALGQANNATWEPTRRAASPAQHGEKAAEKNGREAGSGSANPAGGRRG